MSTPNADRNLFTEESIDFKDNLKNRERFGKGMSWLFYASTLIGFIALAALFLNIINGAFGYVVIENKVDPDTLGIDGVALDDLTKEQLLEVLAANVSRNLYNRFNNDMPFEERSRNDVLDLVYERVVEPEVVRTYNLLSSLDGTALADIERRYSNAEVEFKSWVSWDFITSQQSSFADRAGIRTAIIGTLWVIMITIVFAFPVGVSAAIYLEEYASDNWLNRVLETNIYNLAGVPSIIYGILGLAVFVRIMEPLTSGKMLGLVPDPTTANGRTIFSAGLTLGLLILPVFIVASQEALRAVPSTLRQASYGLGATKWQTIWNHVLPSALPGIMTGTILAVSRAIGETAPLVVIGASTFIQVDPSGPFSKFTVLPIQIYQWTSRFQPEFQALAAGAIIVLLVILLSLNATAIFLRIRFTRRL